MVGMRVREERQRQRRRDIELEIEEEVAIQPKRRATTYTPSLGEFECHCQTHLSYRNWCSIGIQAKRKTPGHRRGAHSEEFPAISMDYMYLNDRKGHNSPILVMHDTESEGVWTIMRRRKGDDEYVARRTTDIISRLDYMSHRHV